MKKLIFLHKDFIFLQIIVIILIIRIRLALDTNFMIISIRIRSCDYFCIGITTYREIGMLIHNRLFIDRNGILI